MKNIIYLLPVLLINFCSNPLENEKLKYTENDLVPLNDSIQNLYYHDAAFIELGFVISDSLKRLNQVTLDEDRILSHYSDLIFIYNNSFKLSNSFFEYASSLHSHASTTLFQITTGVDKNKSWASNWKNGGKYTGITDIDMLIDTYQLETFLSFESDSIYWYEIKSVVPINYFALIHKFKMTSEFIYVDPSILIGSGSGISIRVENEYKYYHYYYGWGDCPSGCLNYHYWIVELRDEELKLLEEGGDPLN